MSLSSTSLAPGRYQYSYPTFVDSPQFIDIHFITPDGQQAFVSYPQHPNRRAPQLVSTGWFNSVLMDQLEGQVALMTVIETLLTGWSMAGRGLRSSRRQEPTYYTRHYQRIAV
ncbi:MAG: hypothetical protein EOO61_16855 [Hymenobacter sp.]|nr:MAG: hypothetical protein EOO61_16855 [Hymenobacter sp.]